MCTTSWPVFLDLSKDECKRILRRLELDAYSTVVSAFRAQGNLTKDKKKLLHDLQNILGISTERHRAEVRRAINDEELVTVADNVAGSQGNNSEWQLESHRLVPLMPRLVPQTAFTVTANKVSNLQAEKNLGMPYPSQTAEKEVPVTKESETTQQGKRQRSSSAEGSSFRHAPSTHASPVTSSPKAGYMQPVTTSQQIMPSVKKVTIGKSPAKANTQTSVSSSGSGQKVIVISSTTAEGTSRSSVMQKAVTTATMTTCSTSSVTSTANTVVHSIPTTATGLYTSKPSAHIPYEQPTNIITVAAPATKPPIAKDFQAKPYVSAVRPRTKTIATPRPRAPQVIRATSRANLVPVGYNSNPGSSFKHSPNIRPANRPPIHIKQEGSMKIITQGTPGSKVLTHPTSAASIRMSSTQPTLVSRTSLGNTVTASSKILNISAGGRIMPAVTQGSVTVNPKPVQVATVKAVSVAAGLGGTGSIFTHTEGKPSVIVMQKTSKHGTVTLSEGTAPTTIAVPRGQSISSPFEKELVSFIQKQDLQKKQIMSQLKPVPAKPGDTSKKTLPVSSADAEGSSPATPGSSESGNKTQPARPSLLAELIHAVGIGPESSGVSSDPAVEECVTVPAGNVEHQWVEYERPQQPDAEETSDMDASAINALLDLQAGRTTSQSELIDVRDVPAMQVEEQIYVIDGSGNIVQSSDGSIDTAGIVQILQADKQSALLDQQHTELPHPPAAEVEMQITGGDLSQLAGLGQEIIGELDPDTGIFYASDGPGQEQISQTVVRDAVVEPTYQQEVVQTIVTSLASDAQDTVITSIDAPPSTPSTEKKETKKVIITLPSGSKDLDSFSRVLNEANIDMDTYQLLEDNLTAPRHTSLIKTSMPVSTSVLKKESLSVTSSAGAAVSLLPPSIQELGVAPLPKVVDPSSASVSTRPATASTHHQLGNSSVTASIQQQLSNSSATASIQQQLSNSSATASIQQQLSNSSATASIQQQLSNNSSHQEIKSITSSAQQAKITPLSQSVVKVTSSSAISVLRQPQPRVVLQRTDFPLPSATHASPSAARRQVGNVTVTVEPSGLDTAHMKIEDFTSQKLEHSAEVPGVGLDIHGDLRSSKRKRKAPLAVDEYPSPSTASGWIRLAAGLLQRVSRFRGSYKEKGELNAASWFTYPVDPQDVPDYYEIIKMPMDFSTIKGKLEMGAYDDWDEFHADMMLVKDNCFQYNPEGSEVRRDCDAVFNFYMHEYDKVYMKWQQAQLTASPSGKKMRTDRSPFR